MKKPRLGKGKNMSIAKAGLVYYYEEFLPKHSLGVVDFIYSGDLDVFHRIVDIAGAKQCSLFTHHQVLNCLRSSPYWQKCGKIQGWGNRWANCYKPSEYGLFLYKKYLKKMKRDY